MLLAAPRDCGDNEPRHDSTGKSGDDEFEEPTTPGTTVDP